MPQNVLLQALVTGCSLQARALLCLKNCIQKLGFFCCGHSLFKYKKKYSMEVNPSSCSFPGSDSDQKTEKTHFTESISGTTLSQFNSLIQLSTNISSPHSRDFYTQLAHQNAQIDQLEQAVRNKRLANGFHPGPLPVIHSLQKDPMRPFKPIFIQ